MSLEEVVLEALADELRERFPYAPEESIVAGSQLKLICFHPDAHEEIDKLVAGCEEVALLRRMRREE